MKGFFEKLKEVFCQEKRTVNYVTEVDKTWTAKEQRVYGMLLLNRIHDNKFTEELKDICIEWALYAADPEICLMSIQYLKKYQEKFSQELIIKVILLNFDTGNQEISMELLGLFKNNTFPLNFYVNLFKWLNISSKVFHSRQTFLLSAFGDFSEEFYQKKDEMLEFLNIGTEKFNVKELIKILSTLASVYNDEVRSFWLMNIESLRKKRIEQLMLFQSYCNHFGIDYFDSNILAGTIYINWIEILFSDFQISNVTK